MNPAKLILLVLVLAGIGGLAYFLLDPGAAKGPPAPPTTAPEQPIEQPPPEKTGPAVATGGQSAPPSEERVRVQPTDQINREAAQGVKGRVMLPSGAPAVEVPVYLLKGSSADPLQFYIAHKLRQKIEPLAVCYTGDDGSFRLGVEKADDKFDLRIVSEEHPELQHKSIKVRPHDWYDTGDLRLEPGGILQGRVVSEEGGFPVARAMVYLTVPGLSYQMLPTPGRERGILAETDNSGFFRYTNAPREGLVTLGAEAPGYAYAELANQQVQPDGNNDFTIKLAQGYPMAGIVVDPNGRPVRGANITANAISSKLPLTASATTGDDGRFELPILRDGPYQLAVSAQGYEDMLRKPFFAGDENVKLVMEQRGRVRLKVLSARGTPIKVYTVGLKRYFANNPGQIGKVPEFRDVRINPGDYDGDYAIVRNVPEGDFVFQIIEGNHAKTLTPPFQMAPGQDPPAVEVTLTMGAAITGTVLDDNGQPVAGAVVATDMNGGIAADTGFFEIFRDFMPDKHTAKSTKTDGNGRFELRQLAFADYMLRISHRDFCEGVSMDIKLDAEGQQKDVGAVRLMRGCLIVGTCTRGGRPEGQIKVTIGPPEGYRPETDANGRQTQMFSATAITNSDGRYEFSKRVPPGQYRIHAFKEAGKDDIFGKIFQMKATQRDLFVAPGEVSQTQNFQLPAQ